MLPGHTKFAPDHFFGQIKKLYRRTSVSSLCEIEEVVRNSIIDGRNVPLTIVNSHTGERCVTWLDWSEHLKKFFEPLPGIFSYQHYLLNGSEPGIVYAKEFENSDEVKFMIALSDCLPDEIHDLPNTNTPPGRSADRQLYLFDNIRQFCSTEEAAEP